MDEGDGNDGHILDLVKGLRDIPSEVITLEMLRSTKCGKKMKSLSKTSSSEEVRALALAVLKRWKDIADKLGYKKKSSKTAANATEGKPPSSPSPSAAAAAAAAAAPPPSSSLPTTTSSSSNVSTNANVPPAPTQTGGLPETFPKIEDKKRSMVQIKLFRLFENPPSDAEKDWPSRAETATVAEDIETRVNTQADSKDKRADYMLIIKRLLYNLTKNVKLRAAVARGYLPPHALVLMKPLELATDEVRDAKRQALEYDKGARRSNWKQANAALMAKQAGGELEDSMYTCPRCKSKKVSNFAMQTRSADEPMTVFCTCIKCNYAFRR